MKRTITFLIAAVIMITSANAIASSLANPLKGVKTLKIVETYLEASTTGNTEFNKYLFADNFEFTNCAAQKTYNKSEYLKFLNATKNLTLNCTNTFEILDESGQACIAKVTMAFDNFVRVDYITMRQGEEGWKISKVVSTYPEK